MAAMGRLAFTSLSGLHAVVALVDGSRIRAAKLQVFGAWQRTPKRARVVAVALTLTAECGSDCCVSAPP